MVVVAAVTAAMIIVLSALNGIEVLVQDLFNKFETELTVLPEQGKVFVINEDTLSLIKEIEGVRMISEIIEEDVWVRNNSKDVNSVCTVKGVQPYYGEMTGIDSMVPYGSFVLEKEDFYYAVPGYGIYTDLKIPRRDDPEILIINAPIRGKKLSQHRENAFRSMPIMVNSTYSVNAELDVKYIFTSLDFCRELFDYPTEMSSLEISLHPDADVKVVQAKIQNLLGSNLKTATREDKNALVYKTNESEKWATFLILLFILIIAAFNIVSSLSMLIIEKKKDIFILRSMGATEETVQRIFIQEGILIYFIGAIIGLIVGIGIVSAQQAFGLIKISGATVTYYPVAIVISDLLIIMASVMFVGFLFSNILVRRLMKRFVNKGTNI